MNSAPSHNKLPHNIITINDVISPNVST
jgi:hypothetical protein